ncbi:FG-GAP-like repeat-containing protein, partial [Chloroflexota bacterium]
KGAPGWDPEYGWGLLNASDALAGFTEHAIKGDFNGARGVYAIDVDGDGDVDVLATAFGADDITWWENDGLENFTEHTIKGDFDGARGVYATDVDGDGDVDVLATAFGADDITWWENDGLENFIEHTIKGDFNGARGVYAIDVDGDGDVDVLGTAYSADDITWWENDGLENFIEHTIKGDFNGARGVYAIDVDGDGDVDVLGAAFGADDITWWESRGLWQDMVPTSPTMEAIVEASGQYYNTAPSFSNFGFDDDEALDDGWYQIDSFVGPWIALFTDVTGTSWDDDGWVIPGFNTLAEGSHTIYFKASDDDANVEGESGEWNWQFHKDTTPPNDPTNVTSISHTPGVWSTDNTVDIIWIDATDATSGLDGYSILWNTSNSTIPDTTKELEEGVQTTTSPALADGNSHYFHIRSVDNAGNCQSTVHIGPFFITTPETPPDPPTVTNASGATNVTTISATLNGAITDTVGEDPSVIIYWGTADGGTTSGSWANNVDIGMMPEGAFFTDIAGLSADTTYFYRCFASNSGGEDWADSTAEFTTPDTPPPMPPEPPTLLSPGTTIHFEWNASSGATKYWLQVMTLNSSLMVTSIFDAELGNVTSQKVDGLTLGTTYYWRIKAGNDAGWGAWSSVRSVVTNEI